jgi:hypothetical protein
MVGIVRAPSDRFETARFALFPRVGEMFRF